MRTRIVSAVALMGLALVALALPETLALFNVSGPEDFFLHVAVRDSAHLQRVLIDHLAAHPEVWHAQTHLIYGKAVTSPIRPDR